MVEFTKFVVVLFGVVAGLCFEKFKYLETLPLEFEMTDGCVFVPLLRGHESDLELIQVPICVIG